MKNSVPPALPVQARDESGKLGEGGIRQEVDLAGKQQGVRGSRSVRPMTARQACSSAFAPTAPAVPASPCTDAPPERIRLGGRGRRVQVADQPPHVRFEDTQHA